MRPYSVEQFLDPTNTERQMLRFPVYPCSHTCTASTLIHVPQSSSSVIADDSELTQRYH